MNKNVRLIWFGFLSWLIPFVFSFLFYGQDGELNISYDLFKSTMVVVGTLSGVYLLIKYFEKITGNYFRQGAIVGSSWLAINIILDSLILIPMAKINFLTYFTRIGFGYFSILIISLGFGYILAKKSR